MNRNPSLEHGALYADFYEFTMAQLYFDRGLHEKPARFEYFFRTYPHYGSHQAGYCIAAGLEWFVDWLRNARFDDAVVEALRRQKSRGGGRLFSDAFLAWLSSRTPIEEITLDAVPEGRVVHPHEPVAVVEGPMAVAQIIETSLLNHLNFQTLIATRACRVKLAGEGRMMMEFGMRRAQGPAAHAGARAALIGGADFSSNTALSCSLGVSPRGTHAHSMVQAFLAMGKGERAAFKAYAESFPDNCLLLLDTVDTLGSGLPNAIAVFQELRAGGHEPMGVRLDSGDLAWLSVKVARRLKDAGFPKAMIVLSNQLDELVLGQILAQIREEAPREGLAPEEVIGRLVYGVGTRLITSAGKGALDGVYKLTALKEDERWKPVLKLSESVEKIVTPGRKALTRIYDNSGRTTADCLSLHNENIEAGESLTLHHPYRESVSRKLPRSEIGEVEPLHERIVDRGKVVAEFPGLEEVRKRRNRDLERLDPGVKRVINPHVYHVSLSPELFDLKQHLIRETTFRDV